MKSASSTRFPRPDDADAITQALETFFSSELMAKRERQKQLLRYLLDEEIAGRGVQIKEYAIALDVFERPDSFDPTIDSVVRVEMGRLRKSLETYYTGDAAASALRIFVPKGSYRPIISQHAKRPRACAERADWGFTAPKLFGALVVIVLAIGLGVILYQNTLNSSTQTTATPTRAAVNRIVVAVLPFQAIRIPGATTQERDFSSALRVILSKNSLLSVVVPPVGLAQPIDMRSLGTKLGADFIVTGSYEELNQTLSITTTVIDAQTAQLVWGHSERAPSELFLEGPTTLMRKAAFDASAQMIFAFEKKSRQKPETALSAFDLYLRAFWAPGTTDSLATETERIRLARAALRIDPNYGPAHAVLAERLTYLAMVDPTSATAINREEALAHARMVASASPTHSHAVFNLAMYRWLSGDTEAAEVSLQRTLHLDPYNLLAGFLLPILPYECKPAPDDVLADALEFDAEFDPGSFVRWLTQLWIAKLHLGRQDINAALQAAQLSHEIFPTLEGTYLLAAILHGLGRQEDANDVLGRLKPGWQNVNPVHYAKVILPERCAGNPDADYILELFQGFADQAVLPL